MSIVVTEMASLFMARNVRDDGKTLAYALVTYDAGRNAGVLWHVHTDPDHRRAGHARELIEALKTQFEIIITGVNTHAGNELVQHCGFELMEGDVTNNTPMLVWTR